MALDTKFGLYAADIAGTLVDQIRSVEVNPAAELLMAGVAGGIEPLHVSIMRQAPTIDFSTTKMSALSTVGISGLALASAAVFTFQKWTVDGGRTVVGSVHQGMTVAAGLVYPVSLRAAQGGFAELTYRCMARYDEANEPIVPSGTAALPEGTPTINALHTVGPVMINGSELKGVMSIMIDFGIVVDVEVTDGHIWPTFLSIRERLNPSIVVTTRKAETLTTLGLDGTAQAETDSVVYLRAKSNEGGNVADETEEHVSFTIAKGLVTVDRLGGAARGGADAVVRINPIYDAVNATLVVSAAAAIT